jgi:hypothetical protein
MSEEFLYGEVPEHFVDRELLRLGKEAFEFCVRQYGDGNRPLRLRWIRKSETDYLYAQVLDNLAKLGGEKVDRLERSYEKIESIYGLVRNRLTGKKEKSGSIFVAAETPVSMIVRVVGHEFYHWKYSPPGFSNETDEQAANKFGERIEREMAEAARAEAMEKWRQRYRELRKK